MDQFEKIEMARSLNTMCAPGIVRVSYNTSASYTHVETSATPAVVTRIDVTVGRKAPLPAIVRSPKSMRSFISARNSRSYGLFGTARRS